MAKNKKSKILAMALCASVMTGIYASPVMAEELWVDGNGTYVNNKIGNGVEQITELEGLDKITVGNITLEGNKVSGNFNLNTRASIRGSRLVADSTLAVVRGSRYGLVSTGDYFAIGDLKINVSAEENKEKATFYVDNATGDVTTKGAFSAANGAFTVDAEDGTFTAAKGAFKVREGVGETVIAGSIISSKDQFGNQGTFNGSNLNLQSADHTRNTSIDAGTAYFVKDGSGTSIDGGAITAKSLLLGTKDVGATIAGIERETVAETTTIEGDFAVNGKDNTFGSKNGSFTVDAEDGTFTAAKGAFKVREGVGETVIAGSIISSKDQFGNQGTFNGSNLNLQSADHTRNTSIDAGTAYFVKDGSGTSIDGGAITAESLTLGSLDGREVGAVVNALEQKTGGIQRVDANLDGIDDTTIIEDGALKISDNGYITNEGGTFAIRSDGSFEMTELNVNNSQFVVNNTGVHMNLGKDSETGRVFDYKGSYGINLGKVIDDIDTRLDVLEDKTQNIKPGTGTGTGTGEGGTAAGEINNILPEVPDTENGQTGINGNVTVGGEINAGEIVVGDKDSENKTTITDGSITTDKGDFGSEVTVGDKTTITSGNITVGADGDQTTINGGIINTGDINAATGDFSESVTVGVEGNQTTINGGTINTDNIIADKGNIGKVDMTDGVITVNGGTTIDKNSINTEDGQFDNSVTVGNVEGNQTTINGGNVAVDKEVTVGANTTITDGNITVGADGDQTTINGGIINTGDINAATGDFSESVTVGVEGNQTTINGGNVAVDKEVTVGANTTITDGKINLGGDNGTNINADGMIVGNVNGVNTNVSAGDVVITDKDGKDIALSDVGYVENIDRELQANGNYDGTVVGGINAEADIRRAEVNRLDNRITRVEDRVDKVGAMSAAIANLRTMGYDPAAPTEIAVGVGQYRSETGVALGMFHYPNRDFMLSLSVSTSGDEVMGGIGATWKFGRKSPEKVAEIKKAQAEADARRAEEAKLAKAEEMKKAAKEAKIKAQQERHAKLAAERAAQAEAAK